MHCKSGEDENAQGLVQTADAMRKVVALKVSAICARFTL